MTVHSNRSLTVSWRDDLSQKYVCYSAEWMLPGRKAAYMSYYSKGNSRMLNFLSEGAKFCLCLLQTHIWSKPNLTEMPFSKIISTLWSLTEDTA